MKKITPNSTIYAAVIGLTNAVLQLVVAFGVTITDAQNAAITTVVNAVLVTVAAVHSAMASKTP